MAKWWMFLLLLTAGVQADAPFSRQKSRGYLTGSRPTFWPPNRCDRAVPLVTISTSEPWAFQSLYIKSATC